MVFDQFLRVLPGPYLGSLAIFEVGIKFCVSVFDCSQLAVVMFVSRNFV